MIKKSLPLVINILFPLAAIIILLLSLLPKISLTVPDVPSLDKFIHIIAYLVLGTLGFFFFYFKKLSKIRAVALTVLVCTVWGIVIELLQSFTGRTPELLDGVVNFIGCQIGAFCALLIQKKGKL